jgi:hypothetical protein
MRIAALTLIAAVVLSLSSLSASAATTYYLNTGDPSAVSACTSQGGTVQSDRSGRKICVIAAQTCAAVALPYVVNPNDANAAQACSAACGTIVMDPNGQRVCVRSSSMREPPNSN